ncbi:MAG: glycosyltransferase family 39 protein [Saprospiraceae bacterium]
MSISTKNLFYLASALLFIGLFSGMSILELRAEEPRRAIVAMEMYLNGSYLVPTIHDWTYFNKPPLFNWILVIFFKLFGSFEEWVVRLPGLLAFIGSGLTIGFFTKKHWGAEAGILAGLGYLTTVDLLFYGAVNSGEIDLFFSFLILLQALSLFHFFKKEAWLLLFASTYLITAVSFLTKGMPAILFQGFSVLGWFLYKKEFKKLFSWQHIIGGLAFLLPVVLYFFTYSKHAAIDPYLAALFKDASRKSAMESGWLEVVQNLIVFPANLLKILLPWSLILLFFFKKEYRNSFKKLPESVVFMLLFILVNIWVYWISPETRNRYLYPFLPMIIYILVWIQIQWKWKRLRTFLWVVIVLATLRIGYNFTIMPYQQENSSSLMYRDTAKDILKITKAKPVHLLGKPFKEGLESSIVGTFFETDTLVTPTLIPFQIPYYLTKGNGLIMKYETQPVQGTFYLGEKKFLEELNQKPLFQFEEKWVGNELVLVQFE